VTEAEWLVCTDPNPMIQFLELGRKGTCRKLRLFGVACCRRVLHFHNDDRIHRIVEVAEEYADGQASVAKRRAANRRSSALCKKLDIFPYKTRIARSLHNAAIAVNWVSGGNARFRTNDRINALVIGGYYSAAAGFVSGASVEAVFSATYEGSDYLQANSIRAMEWKAQSDLLRCIFGNPCRPTVVDPAWFTWHEATLPRLARCVYDGRAFDRLPVLADALEEAGCHDADILAHCRGPGPHVRGCWVVDLLLGKE
jgi:hypothetical protein